MLPVHPWSQKFASPVNCVPGVGRPDSTSSMEANLRPKNLLLDVGSKPLMSWLSCSSFSLPALQQQHSHLHIPLLVTVPLEPSSAGAICYQQRA